ncbi:Ig-like domain-containing protein [Erysipelothrix rhusiopathiae]|nr:Ig-like domain-containing protein [Erysipelothrix rhusiopathiae]
MFTIKGQGTDGAKDSDVDVKGPNTGLVSSIDPTSTQSGQITVGVIDYDLTALTVKFDKTSETVKAKKEIDLGTTITPDSFSSIKESITFTSSKTSVAIVSSAGRVTGQSEGTADITVTVTDIYGNTASDTIQITVTSNTPPVLTLQKLVADAEMNTTVKLSDFITSVTDKEDGSIDPSNVVITPANARYIGTRSSSKCRVYRKR